MPAPTLLGQYPATGGATGTIPGIPDPISTALSSITGNIGNLGPLYGLLNSLTAQGSQNAIQPLISNLPGYMDMTNQSSQNILSDLQGKVSPSTINALSESAAERGVGGGFGPRSPATDASFLKALGLTSEDLQHLGQTELTGAIARTPVPKPIDPMNWLVTAEQKQAADLAQALASAAPDPKLKTPDDISKIIAALNAGMGGVRTPGGGGGGGLDITSGGGGGGPAEIVGGALNPRDPTPTPYQGPGYRYPTNQPSQQQFDQLRQQGLSDEEIAQKLGISVDQVQQMQGNLENSPDAGGYYDESLDPEY